MPIRPTNTTNNTNINYVGSRFYYFHYTIFFFAQSATSQIRIKNVSSIRHNVF